MNFASKVSVTISIFASVSSDSGDVDTWAYRLFHRIWGGEVAPNRDDIAIDLEAVHLVVVFREGESPAATSVSVADVMPGSSCRNPVRSLWCE